MLIKKITLENFRQFKDIQSVDFSEDNEKNITIILGENGAGKTTFAQAFRWCLYGKTTFTDSILLNKEISQNLGPNKESFVRVSLQLIHSNIQYEITREQKYTTNATGELNTPNSSELKIKYRNPQGTTKFEKDVDLRIKEILPSELSNYFFFDGERIQNMSKEINDGRSAEFKEAVERLLGLSAFTITLDHLNGRSSSSVIKSYNRDFDSKANSQIAELQNALDSLNKDLVKIDERNKEIDASVAKLEKQQEELSAEMEANKDTEKLIKEKKAYEISCEKLRKEKNDVVSNYVDTFNTKGLSWFSRKIIRDILTELSETDSLDKGIPDITAKTIDYLKQRGFCICGTCLKENSKELEAFDELLKFIPPKSLGNFISDFSGSAKQRLADSENFYEDSIVQKYREIREKDSELEELNSEILEIEKRIKNIKSSADLQIKADENKRKISELNREKDSLLEEKGAKTEKQNRTQSSLDEQALKSASNTKIAVYKAYATYMYQLLKDDYSKREKEVRERLQKNINEIFKNIYNGKLSLQVDEKYNIKVELDEFASFSGMIETSMAQSMSVIFAFIAGVIKMARENAKNRNSDIPLQSEPYPLVMDAPLSNFDKKRVKNVCETLPKIAEQVIFFSYDKDAEVAEENMSAKIGKKYEFIKINELETRIESR
ncbi:AAA family ATPase [uncultured Treponema sp.]|uniref:AAA family ATPase n=1 Tax=uncultured Treponema sp. TaxID=162155 RepID=UPI000E831F2F|nr:AAA family ATPase [uncultured Treponema sp.]HAZ96919.1 hypothetical protein [Treponema sp.]